MACESNMESIKERTIEESEEMLKLAKLSSNKVLPLTQCLYFSKEHDKQDKIKLLQLDSNLEERLRVGDTLYINGKPHEDIVLCTEDTSYKVFNTETSNSLLLIKNISLLDDLKVPEGSERSLRKVEIQATLHEYLEPVEYKPSNKKLLELLEKTSYKGPEQEYLVKSEDLYSFEELWTETQTSKVELQNSLEKLHALTVDGKIRVLDFEYHFRVLSYMLKLIDENSWPLDEIDFDATISSLNDIVPENILSALFDLYSEESILVDGVQKYKYIEEKVANLFAQVLLCAAGKFNLQEFLQAWQESMPEGMQTSVEMLYGIAIIDRKSFPNVIWSFPESKLPTDIDKRFEVLFEAKEEWTMEEIVPYIECFSTKQLSINSLLAKYSKSIKRDGVKYFLSKHSY